VCRECGQERSGKHRNAAKSIEALKVEKLAAKYAVQEWVRQCFAVRIRVEGSTDSQAESIEAESIEVEGIEALS
jgi:hypothetical protein